MLEVPITIPFQVPLPYKTVDGSAAYKMFRFNSGEVIYMITAKGLQSSHGRSIMITPSLQFVSKKLFQEKPNTDGLTPTVRRFVEFLKANGATSSYEQDITSGFRKDQSTVFWFDVASETSSAYYKVQTWYRGKGLAVTVWCRTLDPVVIGNVQFLDEILSTILKLCIDPVSACARCLKK